jgi:hypothetical protein
MGDVIPAPSANVTGALPHPRLKTPMRLIDHLYFVAEHDDHHHARIWELVSRPLTFNPERPSPPDSGLS